MERVAAVKCSSYQTEEVYQAAKEAICRIGLVIPAHKTVLIKPNIMSQNRPDQHTITHYSLVDALCRILREANCKILIGESISFYQNGLTRKAFKKAGIEEIAKKYGATLIAFEEESLIRVDKNIEGLKELYLPKILLDVDLVIDACKLKTHGAMRLSGALKNLYGCLPGGYKQRIHRWTSNEFELSDVIIDIHKIVKPGLSIMDAVVSLDGGPTALGRPVATSRIFASENAAALDVVASRMIGYQAEELPILIRAKERGLLENFHDIEILGNVDSFSFKKLVNADFERPSNPDSIFVKNTYVDLLIDDAKCTKCKKCIAACPTGAIKEADGKTVIDAAECINCYYCMSVCPENAIKIKASVLNQLMRVLRWVFRL